MKKITLHITLSVLCFTMICFSCSDNKEDQPVDNNISINFFPESLDFNHEKSSQMLEVTANAEWGVTSSESWCTIYPNGGTTGTVNIQVTTTENRTEDSRQAILTFRSGNYKKELTVMQGFQLKAVEFSDQNFETYCIENFDTDGDGIVSLKEALTVTTIQASGLNIKTLDGIEHFTSVKIVNINNNSINAINTTMFKDLEQLNCSGNLLATLNIQSNINLKTLDCTNNPGLETIRVWTGFTPTESYKIPATAKFVEPEIATPLGYKLVWQDEFNDTKDENGKVVLPNTSTWWYETGGGGWGNNELQTYVPGFSGTDTCALVSNGSLKIIAKKSGSQIKSIRMNTIQSWTYGYFEGRLKLPSGKGTWPAFWMMPKNYKSWPEDGEIDIMEEVGYNPNYVSSSIHCKAYYHSIGTQKTAERYVPTAQTEFHIYALEWTKDFIKGYIDGDCHFEFYNDHKGNYDTWPFDNPFYLKLNLAWGGDWGGAMGVDESVLPATYEIDYIRVFQKD